jgi:hypothetical protein
MDGTCGSGAKGALDSVFGGAWIGARSIGGGGGESGGGEEKTTVQLVLFRGEV